MTAQLSQFGAAGKLQSEDEYVHFGARDASFLAFERWLADNMEVIARKGDAGWPSTFARGRVHAFLFPASDSRSFLAGAIGPSADRAGRSFPFFEAVTVAANPDQLRAPEMLPLLLEEFWQAACRRVIAATESGSFEEEASSQRVSFPASEELGQALASFDDWTRAVQLEGLAPLLYDDSPTEGPRLAAGLRGVLDAIAPHRSVNPPRTRLSLRLPLGRAGGAAVCFWLAFVRRAAGWSNFVPGFFWTHDGDWGHLVVHLGVPPKTTLTELWVGGSEGDEVHDAAEPLEERGAVGRCPTPPDVDRVLMNGASTVSELLAAVVAF